MYMPLSCSGRFARLWLRRVGTGAVSIGEKFGMIPLITGGISSIAAIGAHCDDIITGADAMVQPGSPG